MSLTVLEEKDAIKDVIARYCFYYDNYKYNEFADLFTEDALFDASFKLVGKDAIREFVQGTALNDKGLPGVKHCPMNTVIEVNGDMATSTSYFIYIVTGEAENAPVIQGVGHYNDVLIKQNGNWLFKDHKIVFDIMPDFFAEILNSMSDNE